MCQLVFVRVVTLVRIAGLIGAAALASTYSPPSAATTYACWFKADVVKLSTSLQIPPNQQQELIEYLRHTVPGTRLSLSEVESDANLILIFQNVEAGILAIEVTWHKKTKKVDATVKSCDFKRNWKPYWKDVEVAIHDFVQTKTKP